MQHHEFVVGCGRTFFFLLFFFFPSPFFPTTFFKPKIVKLTFKYLITVQHLTQV
jgi:hypothetical protein